MEARSREKGRLLVKSSTLHPTHAIAAERTNAVTSVVLCAQVHAGAVTGLMVGFGVAGYTDIIECG